MKNEGASIEKCNAAGQNSEINNTHKEECRACLERIGNQSAYKLFEPWVTPWAIRGAIIADDLSKFADVEISEFDDYPKFICRNCHNRLSDACKFMITVQMSDSILRQRAEQRNLIAVSEAGTSWPQPILLNKSQDMEVDKVVEVEVKQEVLSEDDNDIENGADIAQDWEPMMDIKIEPEELTAPVPSNAHINGVQDILRGEINSAKTRNSDSKNNHKIDAVVKEEPQSDDEILDALSDLPLDCILCFKVFNTISGLKAHVISDHSYKTVKRKAGGCPSPAKSKIKVQEFTCKSCDQSFKTSTDLMVHRESHAAHVCYTCDRKFGSFQQLMRHTPRCQKKHFVRDQTRPPSRPQQMLQPVRNTMESQKQSTTPETQKLTQPSQINTKTQIQPKNTEHVIIEPASPMPILTQKRPRDEMAVTKPTKSTSSAKDCKTATKVTNSPIDDVTATKPTSPATDDMAASKPTSSAIDDMAATKPTSPESDDMAATKPTSPVTNDMAATKPTNSAIDGVTTTKLTSLVTDDMAASKPTSPTTDDMAASKPTSPVTDDMAASKPTSPETDDMAATKPTSPMTKDMVATKPTSPETDDMAATKPTSPVTNNMVATKPTSPETDDMAATKPTSPVPNDMAETKPTNSAIDDVTATKLTSLATDNVVVATELANSVKYDMEVTEHVSWARDHMVASKAESPAVGDLVAIQHQNLSSDDMIAVKLKYPAILDMTASKPQSPAIEDMIAERVQELVNSWPSTEEMDMDIDLTEAQAENKCESTPQVDLVQKSQYFDVMKSQLEEKDIERRLSAIFDEPFLSYEQKTSDTGIKSTIKITQEPVETEKSCQKQTKKCDNKEAEIPKEVQNEPFGETKEVEPIEEIPILSSADTTFNFSQTASLSRFKKIPGTHQDNIIQSDSIHILREHNDSEAILPKSGVCVKESVQAETEPHLPSLLEIEQSFEQDTDDLDEISEMKVHLAINPLDKDTVLLNTGRKDNCEKSDSCEPKLVNVAESDVQHS